MNIKRDTLTGPRLCAHCHQHKERTEFYNFPRSRDGLSSYCRPCQRRIAKKWNAENKVPHRKDPKVEERIARHRAIRRNVGDISKGLTRRKREATVWLVPLKKRHPLSRRRPKHWTYRGEQNRLVILERANYRCEIQMLGCTGQAIQVDHIKPVRLGGSDELDNLQAACRACNTAKEIELRARLYEA